MKVKVAEAVGAQLNWMAQEALLKSLTQPELGVVIHHVGYGKAPLPYSTVWSQGGPIIEREGITTAYCSGNLGEPRSYWSATMEQQGWNVGYGPYHEQDEDWSLQIYKNGVVVGPTPLIAAMRCYVVSKLGDEVDVPQGLL